MKDKKIVEAYDRCQPSDAVRERILTRVTAKKRPKTTARRLVLAAACVILLAALTTTGFALYEKWHLPAPEIYEPGNQGVRDVHETVVYDSQAVETLAPTPTEDNALTDADFIRMAAELLETVGLTDVNTETMTVAHQTALNYGREEVEVHFSDDRWKTSVRYHAETGALLSFSSIDFDKELTGSDATEDSAEALAEHYYALLPVPQGYVMTDCTQYDEQYWSFDFCRMVEPEVYNAYEMVRIAVNPQSGRLTGCNVFCFPLLDDHAPNDVALTQEEAERIAETVDAIGTRHENLTSAKIEIVLPNWWYTEYDPLNAKYSEVSRYAWVLHYTDDDGEFETQTMVYVDLYTGEILGGDTTG